MESIKRLLVFITLAIGLLGCASSSSVDSDRDGKNSGSAPVHPAAFAADHMMFRRPPPKKEVNDFNFYYKHCQVDEKFPPPKGQVWDCTSP